MNAVDILRRITKPMSDADAERLAISQYGAGRENASRDDPASAQQAAAQRAKAEKRGGVPRGKKIALR